MKKLLRYIPILLLICGLSSTLDAQTRKNPFQQGEELTYLVKFGFIKLGTVVIKTGDLATELGPNKQKLSMKFWTADVPFLNARSTVNSVIDTRELYIQKFQETSSDGEEKRQHGFDYDKAKKTLTYASAGVAPIEVPNVEPFVDALTLVFSMRVWSASGKKYKFPMRGKKDSTPITIVNFTNKFEEIEVPAFDDKEIKARIAEGQANTGPGSPLGASGAFTAYFTDDDAAIPVRIDMKIAVGSISLVLEKVKRPGWKS